MCLLVLIQFPAVVSATDPQAAILRSSGEGVFVNSRIAPASLALFPDDLLQTDKNGRARIEIAGSTVEVGPETIVQYEADELVLDHGSLSVSTGRGLRVRVGCLRVTPVRLDQWTQYDVVDVNGKVTVSALKSDVNIDERGKNAREVKKTSDSNRATVREGEQKSRQDKCGAVYLPNEGIAAKGAILNSTLARVTGTVAVGVVICLGLCHDDDPISPSKPK